MEGGHVADGTVVLSAAVVLGPRAVPTLTAAAMAMDVAILIAVILARELYVAMVEDVVVQKRHVVEALVVLLGHPVVITPRIVVVLVRYVVPAACVAPQIVLFVVGTNVLLQEALVEIICMFATLGKVVRVAVARKW